VIPTDTPCEVAVIEERLGERIHDGPEGEVYHNAYLGTVTLVSAAGREEQIASRGAWNVTVSADGRRIAWSAGTLVEPELFVYDPWAGVSSLGPGAHPTWSPDGRYLVYTVPDIEEHQGGGHSYRADLSLYDADENRTSWLTRTDDVAEMQPIFSPDGRSLAFADWDGGVIVVAPFAELLDESINRDASRGPLVP
jgi:Tol biopolymer transport system component